MKIELSHFINRLLLFHFLLLFANRKTDKKIYFFPFLSILFLFFTSTAEVQCDCVN